MNFSAWWKKEHFGKDYDYGISQAQKAWKASRENTRQAISEYMDFLEDEYPAGPGNGRRLAPAKT